MLVIPRLHDTAGCQTGCTTGLTTVLNEQPLFIQRTATVRSTGRQTGLYNRFDNRLYTRYIRLSNRLSNGFDNRLNVCIHDTTGCQTDDNRLYRVYEHLTGCQTGLTTGMTTGCIELVSWSLTSLFSTNTAISETKVVSSKRGLTVAQKLLATAANGMFGQSPPANTAQLRRNEVCSVM